MWIFQHLIEATIGYSHCRELALMTSLYSTACLVSLFFIFTIESWFYMSSATTISTPTTERPLIIGLNAALQRTISFKSVVKGSVNRGETLRIGIGGKGQNAATAGKIMAASMAASLNQRVRYTQPVLLQFIGRGFEGDQLRSLMVESGLVDATRSSLEILSSGRCRTCITLLDSAAGDATEIIEPSESVSAGDIDTMLAALKEKYTEEKPPAVAIMGSMPPGCPQSLYAQILENCCDRSTKVLLDTTTALSAIFSVCLDKGCESMLKVNARELCGAAGVDISAVTSQSESESSVSASAITDASKKLFDTHAGLTYIACTDGKFPALFLSRDGLSKTIIPPSLPRPVESPIGAGDTVAAGTLLEWCACSIDSSSIEMSNRSGETSKVSTSSSSALNGFLWGLACGAASCMSTLNAVFDPKDAQDIRDGTKCFPT